MYTSADAQVAFVVDEQSIGEEAGSVSVCIDSGVTQGFQTDLTVELAAADGKACKCIYTKQIFPSFFWCVLHDEYYSPLAVTEDITLPSPFSVVFTSSSGQEMCISIPITSDDQLEDDHDFTASITSAGSAPHASVIAAMSMTRIIIRDDERK